MTANVLIACFKREMFRLGIARKVDDIRALQDLIVFEYDHNEWRIPFPSDELPTIQAIKNADDFVEYLTGSGTCNDDFDLSRVLEEDCGSVLHGEG